MKTLTKFALAGIAAALFTTGSAFANDLELQTIDHGNGGVTYTYRRTQKEEPQKTTIAFYSHGKSIGGADDKTKPTELRFVTIYTSQGQISYYEPVK